MSGLNRPEVYIFLSHKGAAPGAWDDSFGKIEVLPGEEARGLRYTANNTGTKHTQEKKAISAAFAQRGPRHSGRSLGENKLLPLIIPSVSPPWECKVLGGYGINIRHVAMYLGRPRPTRHADRRLGPACETPIHLFGRRTRRALRSRGRKFCQKRKTHSYFCQIEHFVFTPRPRHCSSRVVFLSGGALVYIKIKFSGGVYTDRATQASSPRKKLQSLRCTCSCHKKKNCPTSTKRTIILRHGTGHTKRTDRRG